MEQSSKPETDLLGRRWYRIDVYKGDMIYDRISITAMSDEAAELAAHQEATDLALLGKARTLRLYPDDRSHLIAEIKSR